MSGYDRLTGRPEQGGDDRLWRRVLLGPVPLGHVLAGVNIACFVISIMFSLITASDPVSIRALWAPAWSVQLDMGIGGAAPLAQSRVSTLLTAPFLHANLIHLGLNMLCLLMIMPRVEACFGRLRAFIIYGVSGICGALASALWGDTYSLGASGAIFGLFGALLPYGIRRGDNIGRQMIAESAKWAIFNLLFGLTAPVSISNAAHLGGFFGGIASAMVLIYGHRHFAAARIRLVGFCLASLTFLALSASIGAATSSVWLSQTDPQGFTERANSTILEQLNILVSLKPGNAKAYQMRASFLMAREDYEAALPDLDKVIDLGEDTPIARNERAWALFKTGRAASGLNDIEIALRAEPKNPAYLDTRAHIYEALGRREEAIKDYRAALAIAPQLAESRNGLKRMTGAE